MLLLLIKIIPSLLIFQKEFHIRAALKPSVLLGIRNEQETLYRIIKALLCMPVLMAYIFTANLCIMGI